MKRFFLTGSAIIVVVTIAVVVSLYGRVFERFLFSWNWKYKGVAVATGECNMGNPEVVKLKDGCLMMYTHGYTKESNQSENNTYGFSSCDGKNWKYEDLILRNASMPTAIRLDDGRIRLYFARALERKDDPVFKKGIMSAISVDGLKFEEESGYRFEMGAGAPLPGDMEKYREYYAVTQDSRAEDIRDFAHLNAVKTDEGYRIYFDEGGMRADPKKYGSQAWPLSRTRSIFSKDGLVWQLDPGARIDIGQSPLDEVQRIGNPSVLKLADGYHLFFFAGFSPWEDLTPWKRLAWSGTYEAISEDGLNFKINSFPSFPGNDAAVIQYRDKLLAYPGRAQKERKECSDIVMFEKK